MDHSRWRAVERVLDIVLESEPGAWSGILDQHCSGDRELRSEVEALLGRYASARRFLETPPAATAAALVAEAEAAASSLEGQRVGAYRLCRQIGQGGSARVYLAERADGQFTQQVALKVLRPGHDSEIDQVRFRVERQILASLSHPHIARLLDGGVTVERLPYLVLELVDGEPIDRYCAARGLPVRQRLELFLTVAEATQYAHRRLVVHRDLKPSNILVTADGQVKLLDFGLAKLLEAGRPGADSTLPTVRRWMTPEYAAPEQVRGERATTLTDVYQLGAVLYQLLAGRVPFGARWQSPYALEQAILDQEPAAPSTGATKACSELRGDLDAIVLKALRKEPEQRYASVEALADDVRRYLSGHPVQARRQTTAYRARRFLRRHRWKLAAAGALVVVAGAYAVTATVQNARVRRALAQARDEAQRAEQVTRLMLGLFEASERGRAFGDTVTARALLDRGLARARGLAGQPVLKGQMLDAIGQIQQQLGDNQGARGTLGEALTVRREALGESHPDVAATLHHLGDAAYRGGDAGAAIGPYREALAIRRTTLGDADPLTLESLYWLANSLHDSGERAESRALHDEWAAAVLRAPPVMSLARADQLINLAQFAELRSDLETAERLVRQALAIRRGLLDAQHPDVGSALHRLGSVLRNRGKMEESEEALREGVGLLRAAFPEGHSRVADAVRSLGITLDDLGRWDQAAILYADAERLYRRSLGDDHVFVGIVLEDQGKVYRLQGAYDRAEAALRAALGVYRARLGHENLMVKRAEVVLGEVLRARGAFAEAEPLLVGGYEAFSSRSLPGGSGDRAKRLALESLVKLYEAQGREDEAEKYRALIPAK